jgi:very-short-patch-repair endonuclease
VRAEDALVWRGGFATWAELRALVPRRAMARALADGSVVRARRGRYARADLEAEVAAAAALGGVLSHESAARMLGLPTLHPQELVHVTVPRSRHTAAPQGVRVHRVDLAPRDVRDGVTRPARTVLDVASQLPFADALAIADGVLREGLLSPTELRAAADETHGPGRARRRRIARAAHPGAANPFESGLRAIVLERGLPGFEPQYRVPGTPFVVDLADPSRRICLEADSFAHHASRGALRNDCRRYDELTRLGWLVLRFAWEHVMFEQEWVGTMVEDCCRLR